MTVYERVITSRLIEKIENNRDYSGKIGLSYTLSTGQSKICTQKIAYNSEKKVLNSNEERRSNNI